MATTKSRPSGRRPRRDTRLARRAPIFTVLVGSVAVIVGAQRQPVDIPTLLGETQSELSVAVARYDRDGIAAAADSLRRIVELNPRYAEAYVGLGEALLWLSQFDQAAVQFARARALRYTGADIDLLEARLAALSGDIAGARSAYERIVVRQPYNEQALVGIATLDFADGPTAETMQTLQSLEQRYPENRQLLAALIEASRRRGDAAAVQRYVALALQYHGDNASIQLVAARSAFDGGDMTSAERHARNATILAPTLAEAWLILAHAADRRGEPDRALAYYQELIRIDPDNHIAWYARAIFLARVGRFEEAQRSWERSLRIRPDYELARIALENTLVEAFPLEDTRRRDAALRYRASGAALRERFLNRQAERHFRRGLQINPYDAVLRRNLGELYLQRDMESRYLQELLLIRDLGGEGAEEDAAAYSLRELTDRIGIFSARTADEAASRWSVDQFTVGRPRTTLSLYANQSATTIEPDAAHHVVEYAVSLLQGSQNLTVVDVRPPGASRSAEVAAARRAGADLVGFIDVDLGERRIVVDVQILRSDDAGVLLNDTFVGVGNGRVDRVARDVSTAIASLVVPRGYVIDRRFERVLVSLGGADGLAPEGRVAFRSRRGGEPLGEGEVVAVDDLVAEVTFQPEGADNLTVGDVVEFVEPEETVPAEEVEEAEAVAAPPEQTSRAREIVQQLFRLR